MDRCKHGYLGRKPVDKSRLHSVPRLAAFMAPALPAPPPAFDYTQGVTAWGAMLNTSIGNCEVATAGHLQMGWTNAAAGAPIAIADADILAAYVALTGYDPATGANDDGVATLDLLNYWQTKGIAGNKIAGYAAVDPTNHAEVAQAIYIFGGVMAGVNLPKSAEEQTDAGQPWSPVFWSPNVGGHMIPYLSYGTGGTQAITWGAVQPVTWDFTDRQCDEMYVVLDMQFFASGRTPRGLDLAGMQAAMEQLRAA